MKKQVKITIKDLMDIHSLAVTSCIELPYHSELHKSQNELAAYSWINAVIIWLNSKDLLDIEIVLDKKINRDNNH